MTTDAQPTPAPPATPAPGPSREGVADALELLGLVAQLEHTAFVRLAADSAIAPTVEQRLALSRFAAAAVERRDRVIARIEELGADAATTLQPFDDVLDEFDARTPPSSWWERLLKAYVGYGVADDFCRLAAQGLDERSRAVVLDVLDDASHAELAVAELDAAGAQDDALSSRLALWGRRLVGEALSVVQRLVAQRPGLARLARAGAEPEAAAADQTVATDVQASTNVPTKVFGELTAQHTRRMGRLGLTP
ncbi:ferritin-like domain-containing protein [Cellulomonas sp. DKR-3]|uniref:Ferritin-like domain-containing protein n=1 Tax=Cellulomonas fulva TaxID=2835530 RepID=A0ABS5TZ79_9CELL|nr:ferritin-like fold-containing protein [Cellulomonas fulva]MBT0994465.1 ferritin-like domain-containing protein [Cellulomonas fulva]